METETQELRERLDKHEDETKEGFRMTKEELSEMRGEIEQVKDELNKVRDEQAQMQGKVNDIKTELVECIETRCKRQDVLLQKQRESISSLEVDCDQVTPVGPCEVERVHDVNGYMQSLGGGEEASGPLVVTRIPDVIVPESVSRCASGVSNMACVSACMEMDDGPIQTGMASLVGRTKLFW